MSAIPNNFVLLTADNYNMWKIEAESVLGQQLVWDYVTGRKPTMIKDEVKQTPSTDEYMDPQAKKAESLIVLMCSPAIKLKIVDNVGPKAKWLAIQELYSKSTGSEYILFIKMFNLTYNGIKFDDHVNNLLQMWSQIKVVWPQMLDVVLVLALMKSLSKDYNTMMDSIAFEENITFDKLCMTIKRREGQRGVTGTNSTASSSNHANSANSAKNQKQNNTQKKEKKNCHCNYCQRDGSHEWNECRDRLKDLAESTPNKRRKDKGFVWPKWTP